MQAKSIFFAIVVALFARPVVAQTLLEPSKAFQLSAIWKSAQQIEVRYQIAPGYYIYAPTIKIQTPTPALQLGALERPGGRPKVDAFMGVTEIYSGNIAINVPVLNTFALDKPAQITVQAQGCKESKVCFAPFKQTVEVTRVTASTIEAPSAKDRFLQIK